MEHKNKPELEEAKYRENANPFDIKGPEASDGDLVGRPRETVQSSGNDLQKQRLRERLAIISAEHKAKESMEVISASPPVPLMLSAKDEAKQRLRDRLKQISRTN